MFLPSAPIPPPLFFYIAASVADASAAAYDAEAAVDAADDVDVAHAVGAATATVGSDVVDVVATATSP